MTLLESLVRDCDSLFLQRIDAAADVSIFSTPIAVANGATVPVPAPNTSGLTFAVSSDDLGLGRLIVPAFDILFSGVPFPGADGTADRVVWTASTYPSRPPGTVSFQLANANSLAIDIESITGSVTTTLASITPPAFVDDARGRPEMAAVLLEGPGAGEGLQIGTSFGTVTVKLNRIQLVAVQRLPSASVPAPTFTMKLKPSPQGSGGEFRIAGMSAPFNMKLVGADEAWTCNVQLQGTPGLVTVTLTVTRHDAGALPGPGTGS